MNWFNVDKAGLAKLLADRPKSFVINELVANALDSQATKIEVEIEAALARGHVTVKVTDDDPKGFENLAHAYTLYAESTRKGDAEKRGRFNLGEKLVLAISKWATITTTTGQVTFHEKGRTPGRARRSSGSQIECQIACRKDEMFEMIAAAKRIMPRPNCELRINGEIVPYRQAFKFFETTLQTVIADDEGHLRSTRRKTTIELLKPLDGENAMLYELGIPVVETGDEFHVNVGQKVPLNMDRDNVTPAYLHRIRVEVLNAASHHVSSPTQAWIRDALASEECSAESAKQMFEQQYGETAVAFDPSDLEANKRAVSEGRQVVHGGSLSADQWNTARRAGVLLPAGIVTPSAKPYSPDGKPLELIPQERWTPNAACAAMYARMLAKYVLNRSIEVRITNDQNWPFSATYGPGRLTLNQAQVGSYYMDRERLTDLLIHEFGHEYCDDHLSPHYYRALTKIGAKMVTLAIENPKLFVLA